MSIGTLRSLFAYKAWANSELFALLATLPPSQAEALHTCIRTLNHVYVAAPPRDLYTKFLHVSEPARRAV